MTFARKEEGTVRGRGREDDYKKTKREDDMDKSLNSGLGKVPGEVILRIIVLREEGFINHLIK